MKDKIFDFLRVTLMSMSKVYDPFFRKKFNTELGSTYSKKIVNHVNNNMSVKEWDDNVVCLKNDIQKYGLSGFLRYKTILRTMFVTNRFYILKELFYVRRFLSKRGIPNKSIHESFVGFPARYVFYPFSSGNLIHHAYSLCHYLEKTDRNINDFGMIFEFGGGYGSFERVCRNIGFNGDYIIYDLEEVSLLQEYYLNALDEESDSIKHIDHKTKLISNPNKIPDIDNPETLFVALWSLSEAPIEARRAVKNVINNSRGILIGMQDSFTSINNIDYFNSIFIHDKLLNIRIPHIDNQQSYLIK